jgi:recombination protein RecR
MLPSSIKKFVQKFSKLPSVGPRLAARIGLHIATLGPAEFKEFHEAFLSLGEVNPCPYCFGLKPKTQEFCSICTDKSRDPGLVAVVEKETDIEAMEESRAYKGLYVVVGDAPHNGILTDIQKNRLKAFKAAITEKKRVIREIIIALPQNTFGDTLADTLKLGLQGVVPKITRLGRGLPTGGTVEFADSETLKGAIERRI